MPENPLRFLRDELTNLGEAEERDKEEFEGTSVALRDIPRKARAAKLAGESSLLVIRQTVDAYIERPQPHHLEGENRWVYQYCLDAKLEPYLESDVKSIWGDNLYFVDLYIKLKF